MLELVFTQLSTVSNCIPSIKKIISKLMLDLTRRSKMMPFLSFTFRSFSRSCFYYPFHLSLSSSDNFQLSYQGSNIKGHTSKNGYHIYWCYVHLNIFWGVF